MDDLAEPLAVKPAQRLLDIARELRQERERYEARRRRLEEELGELVGTTGEKQ